MRKDVTIGAPVARLEGQAAPLEPPPLEELYRLTSSALKDERRKTSELSDFARQTASLALSMARMLADQGLADEHGRITVPRELHKEMLGASISVGEKLDGDLFVRISERGRERIHAVQ